MTTKSIAAPSTIHTTTDGPARSSPGMCFAWRDAGRFGLIIGLSVCFDFVVVFVCCGADVTISFRVVDGACVGFDVVTLVVDFRIIGASVVLTVVGGFVVVGCVCVVGVVVVFVVGLGVVVFVVGLGLVVFVMGLGVVVFFVGFGVILVVNFTVDCFIVVDELISGLASAHRARETSSKAKSLLYPVPRVATINIWKGSDCSFTRINSSYHTSPRSSFAWNKALSEDTFCTLSGLTNTW